MGKVMMSLEMPISLHDKLLALSIKRTKEGRVSMSEHIRRAIEAYIDGMDDGK